MRIAVTGGSGFVGRHVITAAAARGWAVRAPVRSSEAARVVEQAGAASVMVRGLGDERLAAAFDGAEAVLHLAMIGAPRGGDTLERVNVEGTLSVIAAARAAGAARLVLFSGLGVARYGQAPRSTNDYFRSKLTAEVEAFRSGLDVFVLRPSYVVGPGDGFVTMLLRQMAGGVVEQLGDGAYHLQPVAVRDAAEAAVAAAEVSVAFGRARHRVVDLVGPATITFAEFVEALAGAAREAGRPADFEVRSVSVAEAEQEAAAGGWHGMLPDELDCVLCDEVGDPGPLESILGRRLTPLGEALRIAVAGARA